MKPIRFGMSDKIYYKLKSIAADRNMSLIDLMGYVIGTFLWVIEQTTKDRKIVSVGADDKPIKMLEMWGDDEETS